MTRIAPHVDLPGDVVRPGDPAYDAARSVFNGMIDRRPLAVLRCRDAGDVSRGVGYARERGLPLSVRGGGHNVAGTAVCDDGIVLDLSRMTSLHVDPAGRTAWAGPGLTLGGLDRGTQEHGLATPLGVMSGTGIAGLTLGGGLGWLTGKHGLACDNLVAADVVTADGALVRASADEHPDLFWALRGGGGNFGVVTAFRYRLHPVGPVLAGGLAYPWSRVREVLRCYDDLVATAPDELSTAASLGRGPDGEPTVGVAVCWSGPHDEGMRVLRPLREFGPCLADSVGVVPFLDWQSGPDAAYPTGRLHYWKAGWLPQLSGEAVETAIRHIPDMPSALSGVGLQRMAGAASRVPASATAFAHRAVQYDFLVLSQWTDPADTARNVAWSRALHEDMRPHLDAGAYVNNLGDEGGDRVRAAYGPNYPRLVEVKRVYDPGNLFRLNQNVTPAPAG